MNKWMVRNVNRGEGHPFFVSLGILYADPPRKHCIYVDWHVTRWSLFGRRCDNADEFLFAITDQLQVWHEAHHSIFLFILNFCNANKTTFASFSRCPTKWCINTKFNDGIKINWINSGKQCECCLFSPLSNVYTMHLASFRRFSSSLRYYVAVGERTYNVGGCAMIDKKR